MGTGDDPVAKLYNRIKAEPHGYWIDIYEGQYPDHRFSEEARLASFLLETGCVTTKRNDGLKMLLVVKAQPAAKLARLAAVLDEDIPTVEEGAEAVDRLGINVAEMAEQIREQLK